MSLMDNFPRWVWYVWMMPIAFLLMALSSLVFAFAWNVLFAKDIEASVCGNDIKIHTSVYETVKRFEELLKVEADYRAASLSATRNHCRLMKRGHHTGRAFCNAKELEHLSDLLDKERKGLEQVDRQLEQLRKDLEARETA